MEKEIPILWNIDEIIYIKLLNQDISNPEKIWQIAKFQKSPLLKLWQTFQFYGILMILFIQIKFLNQAISNKKKKLANRQIPKITSFEVRADRAICHLLYHT